MSLNKAIVYGKEHRKPYRGGKAVSYHCRNNGGKTHKDRNPWQCEWCLGNRLYKNKKSKLMWSNEGKNKGDDFDDRGT